jgi:hypothetical protein
LSGGGAIYIQSFLSTPSELALNRGKLTANKHIPATGDARGGGVCVDNDGRLTFGPGPVEISGSLCESSGSTDSAYGGGLYIGGNVSVTIPGGGNISITHNTVRAGGGGNSYGGGIACESSFDLPSGLTINGNKALSSAGFGYAGGVYFWSLSSPAVSVNMTGAIITDNEAARYGGGLYLYTQTGNSMTFTMTAGRISGNKVETPPASSVAVGGGGMLLTGAGSLTTVISGGVIESNEAVHTGASEASGGGI